MEVIKRIQTEYKDVRDVCCGNVFMHSNNNLYVKVSQHSIKNFLKPEVGDDTNVEYQYAVGLAFGDFIRLEPYTQVLCVSGKFIEDGVIQNDKSIQDKSK